jgi:CO dehydrogenase maturation factor
LLVNGLHASASTTNSRAPASNSSIKKGKILFFKGNCITIGLFSSEPVAAGQQGMAMKISVCGKGGSGKSTVVALLAKAAQQRELSVVVVDSDESNSSLFKMLGFEYPPTPLLEMVGGKASLKEKMKSSEVLSRNQLSIDDLPVGYLQRKDHLSLVSIGKILQSLEGCACPMGVLSREFLKKLRLPEKTIAIIDMEAGIEHFGRGIDQFIDKVLLVVEPSYESMEMASKIRDLAAGIQKEVAVVLNKMPSEEIRTKVESALEQNLLEVIGAVPEDPVVFKAGLEGRQFVRGKALDAAADILDRLIIQQ